MGMQSGGVIAGFLDISPANVGMVFAMSNTLATIPGVLAPSVTEAILYAGGPEAGVVAPADNWRAVFFLGAGLNVAAAVVYMVFSQASRVPALD